MAETTTTPAWTARQSNTDEAEGLRVECAHCGHARVFHPASEDGTCQTLAWRTSYRDCKCEHFVTAGVEPANEFNYQAQQRIDARILAEQAADWARIAAGAGASTANRPDAQHQAQTYALASIALSLAYGSDRP